MTSMYESYLAHHGVKGMRWGVRKQRKSNIQADSKIFDAVVRDQKTISRARQKQNQWDKEHTNWTGMFGRMSRTNWSTDHKEDMYDIAREYNGKVQSYYAPLSVGWARPRDTRQISNAAVKLYKRHWAYLSYSSHLYNKRKGLIKGLPTRIKTRSLVRDYKTLHDQYYKLLNNPKHQKLVKYPHEKASHESLDGLANMMTFTHLYRDRKKDIEKYLKPDEITTYIR